MCSFYALLNEYFPARTRHLNRLFGVCRSRCPLGESEVSLGLHAVKAQAAAMLCSSCPPSSPTYREQNASLIADFARQTGRKVPPENASVPLLCILAAKTNTRRRVSIKLVYFLSLFAVPKWLRRRGSAARWRPRPASARVPPPLSRRLPRQLSNPSCMHWMGEGDGGMRGESRARAPRTGLQGPAWVSPHSLVLKSHIATTPPGCDTLNLTLFRINFYFDTKLKSFFSRSVIIHNMHLKHLTAVCCSFKHNLTDNNVVYYSFSILTVSVCVFHSQGTEGGDKDEVRGRNTEQHTTHEIRNHFDQFLS